MEKYKKKLWQDLNSDIERAEFIECGRAHETGIIAKSIEDDLAKVYRKVSATGSNCNIQRVSNNEVAVCTCKHDPPVRKVEDGTEICCECKFLVQTNC